MASTDATAIPVKNQAYRVTFPILDNTGSLVTGAAGLDSEVSKDAGTFADCTNEATEIATASGMYTLDLSATEMNADTVALIVKTSTTNARTTPIVLYPRDTADLRVTVETGGITAASFAAGAIDAAAIATDAIGSAEIAASAATEIAGAVWDEARSSHTAAGTFGRAVQIPRDGTAQAGSGSTITLDAGASAVDNFYNSALIHLVGGTGVGQSRFVSSYVGATKVATVNGNWQTAPDATSVFIILPFATPAAVSVVGTVTGAVGSVAGAVGSVAAGGITATSFASGAIDAAAIATDAIGSAELAASAVTEIAAGIWDEARSGHTTAGSFGQGVASVQGNVTGSVGSVTAAVTVGTNNDKTGYALTTLESMVLHSGTAQAGTAGTVTLAAGASATTDFYKGAVVKLYSGTGAGQARTVTAYNGTTKVATLDRNWATNPDNTSLYAVLSLETPALNASLEVAASAVNGNVTGSVGSIASGGITSASFTSGAINATAIATDAIGAAELAADAVTEIQAAVAAGSIASVTGNVGGNVTGSVGSVASGGISAASFTAGAIDASAIATDAIGSAELAASAVTEIAAGVWDEARSGHTTAGSFGQGVASVQGNVTGSVGSVTGTVGSVTGAVGSVASGGISSASFAASAINAAAIATDAITAAKIAADAIGASELATDAVTEIQAAVAAGAVASVTGAVGSVTGNVGGNVTGSVGSLGATAKADVNAEVVDALATDTYAELSGVPAANASLADKIRWLFLVARNRVTSTATTITVRNDGDSGSVATSTQSDDATTYVRGKFS